MSVRPQPVYLTNEEYLKNCRARNHKEMWKCEQLYWKTLIKWCEEIGWDQQAELLRKRGLGK